MNRMVMAAALCFGFAPSAWAQQDYPTKTIRIIVPFAPGGSTDIFARYIADKLAPALAQPVVVENRAGAGGNIGAEAVARAAPDGYTLLMATTGVMSINNALYPNMTYDAAKDFEPVIFVASITNVLAVPPELPANSVRELIALAKEKPGSLSFGSSGAGSSTHLSSELFKSMAGIDVLHVPYKGSSQALTDLIAGRITMVIDNMPSAISFIKAGRLRALGVTGSKRSPALPDVPTIAEAALPGYESLSWSGIAVPAGTSKEVIARLNRDIATILAQADIREKFAQAGADPVGGSPQEFAAHIRAEREKWSKLIRERGIALN
jgi:tripartite-type tricarboxylate transporter receptor subunit TctC